MQNCPLLIEENKKYLSNQIKSWAEEDNLSPIILEFKKNHMGSSTFFKNRKISIGENLLKTMNLNEIYLILAHEYAHHKYDLSKKVFWILGIFFIACITLIIYSKTIIPTENIKEITYTFSDYIKSIIGTTALISIFNYIFLQNREYRADLYGINKSNTTPTILFNMLETISDKYKNDEDKKIFSKETSLKNRALTLLFGGAIVGLIFVSLILLTKGFILTFLSLKFVHPSHKSRQQFCKMAIKDNLKADDLSFLKIWELRFKYRYKRIIDYIMMM